MKASRQSGSRMKLFQYEHLDTRYVMCTCDMISINKDVVIVIRNNVVNACLYTFLVGSSTIDIEDFIFDFSMFSSSILSDVVEVILLSPLFHLFRRRLLNL